MQTPPNEVGPNQPLDWLVLGLGVRRVEQSSDGVLLLVVGEVDLATAPALARRLHRELAQSPTRLQVDLSAVTFCSVRGVEVLSQAADDAYRAGVEFLVSGASPLLRRVMRTCGEASMITWMDPTPIGQGRRSSTIQSKDRPPDPFHKIRSTR